MGLGERIRFFFDSRGMLESLIERWKPIGCETEKQYEESLYNFLQEQLENIRVDRQYAWRGSRIDIAVGDQVLIELKHDLSSITEYRRLVGQLMAYKDWRGYVFVILTGGTERNLGKELTRFLEEEGFSDSWLGPFDERKVTLINK